MDTLPHLWRQNHRAYDRPDSGGMGKPLGKGEAEQGTEAPETPGSMETGTAEGICCSKGVSDQI